MRTKHPILTNTIKEIISLLDHINEEIKNNSAPRIKKFIKKAKMSFAVNQLPISEFDFHILLEEIQDYLERIIGEDTKFYLEGLKQLEIYIGWMWHQNEKTPPYSQEKLKSPLDHRHRK